MPSQNPDLPVSVQVLSILMFGGFSIVAVALAFNAFWPAGFALAAIIAWRGGFLPTSGRHRLPDDLIERLRSLSPEAEARRASHGNTSFDAYRQDTLNRLEAEQTRFDGFLDRLRDAKDKSEFDAFMDERAKLNREAKAE
jgi:hypothetical protein